MEEFIKKYWRNSMLTSILLIILSLVLMLRPVDSLLIVVIFFGVTLFITGIAHIISYVVSDHDDDIFNFEFLEGLLYSFFGLLIGLNPHILINSIGLVTGIWIVINALVRIQIALNMPSDRPKQMWVICLSTLIFMCGMLIIANPTGVASAMPVLVGSFLFLNEVINIVEYICIISKMKKVVHEVKGTKKK